MENLAARLSWRMEHEPLHPLISQKIHWQPDLSFRPFNYTAAPIIENMGSTAGTSSVVKPSPPAFVGAPMEKSSKASLIKELVALGLLKAVAAPFERVKLLLQNQKDIIKSGRLHKPYNGILHCFATTIRNEGIFSLWRGYTAMTMVHVSATVIRFGIFQYTKNLDDTQWSYTRVVVSSYVASAATQFLVYPFLYAATRMATDVKTIGSNTGDRQFNGMIDVFRKTLKSDGIVGLYRGFNITLGELVMMGALSKGLNPWKQHYSYILRNNFLSSHMVDFGFWISGNMATYPLDTVSRRMMMTSGSGTVKYKSTVHAIGQITKTEGVKTFYNGAGAEILACAANRATLLLMIYVADVTRAAKEKQY
uniref:ADP/ATP translocase n=1 Tax=Gossypium raimondii TaxID=29730 RepID=A0A0D2ULK4_GOSRA|nr:hypothetical protein B456_011G028800 [Gossypium raimondii]